MSFMNEPSYEHGPACPCCGLPAKIDTMSSLHSNTFYCERDGTLFYDDDYSSPKIISSKMLDGLSPAVEKYLRERY